LPSLRFSSTVTVTAIDFAIRSGLSKIALVGSDLCLDPEIGSHLGAGVGIGAGETEPFDVAGLDGSPVRTVKSLFELKQAVERYLAENVSGNDCVGNATICNCTETGTAILGLPHRNLESFLEENASKNRQTPIWSSNPEGLPHPDVRSILLVVRQAFSQIHENQSAIFDRVNHVIRERDVPQPGGPVRDRLRKSLAYEQELSKQPTVQPLLRCFEEFADEIFLEVPKPGPTNGVSALHLKSKLKRDLARDFLEDVEGALDGRFPSDPRRHGAFRAFAVEFFRNGNPAFAQWIESGQPPVSPAELEFEIVPRSGRFLPEVNAVRANGTRISLSGGNSAMDRIAREETNVFIDRHRLRTSPRPVVFAAPGNWQHVTVFAEQFPESEILILDPFPELLRKLVEYSLVLHLVPQGVRIFAPLAEMPDWRRHALETLSEWRERDPELPVFRHPRCFQVPEIVESFETWVSISAILIGNP
jgi:hypothetical protein